MTKAPLITAWVMACAISAGFGPSLSGTGPEVGVTFDRFGPEILSASSVSAYCFSIRRPASFIVSPLRRSRRLKFLGKLL
jgi:hypothetical protein